MINICGCTCLGSCLDVTPYSIHLEIEDTSMLYSNQQEAHAALILRCIEAAFLFFRLQGGALYIFKNKYESWTHKQIEQEKNHRRRRIVAKRVEPRDGGNVTFHLVSSRG